MARLALTIVGGVIGAFFGGPLGAKIGMMVGGLLGSFLFPGKGQHVEGPRLTDMQVMSSAPGVPIPFLYGSMRLGGQIFWSPGLKEHKKTTTQSVKGAPSNTQTTYSYTCSAAVGICEGPATITKIYGDAKLMFDRSGTGQIAKNLHTVPTFYTGDETQLPNPVMVAADGADVTPAYRGLCYFFYEDLELQDFGNRLPNFSAEATANGTPAYPLTRIQWDFNSDTPGYCVTDPQATTAFVLGLNGHITRYDIIANTKVAEGLLDATNLFGWTGGDTPSSNARAIAVDNDGFFWALGRVASHVQFIKYDSWSFKAVASVDLNGYSSDGFFSYSDPNYCHMLVNPDGSSLMLTGNSGYSNLMFAIRTRDHSIVGVSTDFRAIPLPADSGPTISLFFQNYPVLDNNANAYVIGIGIHDSVLGGIGGDWYIWRVNLQGGTSHFVALAPQYTGVARFSYMGDSTVGMGLSMLYNEADNTLIVYTNVGAFLRIDADTGEILETIGSSSSPMFKTDTTSAWNMGRTISRNSWLAFSDPFEGSTDTVIAAMKGRVQNGVIWAPSIADSEIANVYSVTDFSLITTYDLHNYSLHPTPVAPDIGVAYETRSNSLLSFSLPAGSYPTTFAFHRFYFDRVSTNGDSVDGVVLNLCERASLTAGQVDVTDLTSLTTRGYPIVQLQDAKTIIGTLAQAYFFDAVESDGKLKFVRRGHGSVATIDEVDLGLDSDQAKLTEELENIQDVPKTVEVMHIDPNQDYQQGKQKKIRHSRTIKSLNQISLQIPLVMTGDEAAQLAEKLLWTADAERHSYTINLWKASHLLLDATDVVQFHYNGALLTARIGTATIGQGFATALQLKSEDSNNYTSAAVGNPDTGFVPQTIAGLALTLAFLLDMPYLRDIDADAVGNTGFYAGLTPQSSGIWPAGVLFKSSDAEAWDQMDSSTDPLGYGIAQNALAAPATPWTWDYVNTLTVRMVKGSNPSSTTSLNVLNGKNVAILYPSLEIIQFQNATLNGDGTYTLDTLLRGRRGTEWACGKADVGERVLFPLGGGLLHEQVALALLNQTRYYKPVTVGDDLNSGSVQTLAVVGRDLKPYAPCQITGSRDISNNLTIQWQRRVRLGAKNIAGGRLGLAEDTESYDVVIVDGSGNVKRTFANVVPNSGPDWVSPAFPHQLYSAANQTSDGFTPGDPIHVILYQNSVQVGRGFATPTTVI